MTSSDELGTRRSSRRRFMRQAGTTLAAALGLAVLPAAAKANEQQLQNICCKKNCRSCPGGIAYECSGCAGSGVFCQCFSTDRGQCFTAPCP